MSLMHHLILEGSNKQVL